MFKFSSFHTSVFSGVPIVTGFFSFPVLLWLPVTLELMAAV